MSETESLQRAFHEDQIRALNAVVREAEALDVPELPDVPDWEKSPANAETLEGEDPVALRALALEWQAWASKLDDILRELSLEVFEAELSSLRDSAKDARLALIELDAYRGRA